MRMPSRLQRYNRPMGTPTTSPLASISGAAREITSPVVASANSMASARSCTWPPIATTVPATAGPPSYDLDQRPGGGAEGLSPPGKGPSRWQGDPRDNGQGRPAGTEGGATAPRGPPWADG